MFETSFGMWPIFLIVLAGVLIFGKDLPEVARAVARQMAELRQVFNSFRDLADPKQWEAALRKTPTPLQELPTRPVVRRPSSAPPFQD